MERSQTVYLEVDYCAFFFFKSTLIYHLVLRFSSTMSLFWRDICIYFFSCIHMHIFY